MGYKVFERNDKFQPRKGLEGPFQYPNGRVLYYDPKQGQYYDSTTDFYVPADEVANLHTDLIKILQK